MSKSLGNVIDPFDLLNKYGIDYVRYFLVADIPFGNDGDFNDDLFIQRVNSNLANDYGNLVQRVLSLISKNCNGIVPSPGTELTTDDIALLQLSEDALDSMRGYMESQAIHRMCEVPILLARAGNKYIDTQAPWSLKKTDVQRMNTVLYVLAELIRKIGILLQPVMPQSCGRVLDMLNIDSDKRTFASLQVRIVPGVEIKSPVPVFPKIETAESLSKKKLVQ